MQKAKLQVPRRAAQLEENHWTDRLHRCLNMQGFMLEFSAPYGKVHKKYWRSRLPEKIGKYCFLFRGTPDLIIHQINTTEGLVVEKGFSKNLESDDQDSDQSSDHSSRCEAGHKNEKSYDVNSSIVEKGGELVAAIHLSLVCRALRKFRQGIKVTQVVGHGLLIHRATAVVHMEVRLSQSTLQVEANVLADGHLNAELLCKSFKYLLEKVKTK